MALSRPVRHIATFHLNPLGDLLFTLPALQALREGFPDARIHAVVRPALAPLLTHSPLIDEVVLRPRGGFWQQMSLVRQLRARHLDLAVVFSQSRHTVSMSWLSGAKTRVGFTAAHHERLLTHQILRDEASPPTVDSHLDLARALGCPSLQNHYSGLLSLPDSAHDAAAQLLKQHGISGPFVMAAPEASARRGIKEWPLEHWSAALAQIAQWLPVVLVGTRSVTSITGHRAPTLFDSSKAQPIVDLGGRTNLLTLAALCKHADLFVGIDSGVMHLAAAMGTPVVAIFGPTSEQYTFPRGVPHQVVRHEVECSPCHLSHCKWVGQEHRKCLTRLAPLQVADAVRSLLQF